MRTKKIFTPMIAVGLIISLSMGTDINFDTDNQTYSLNNENSQSTINNIHYGGNATTGNINFDAPNISLRIGDGSFSLENGKTLNFNINENATLTQSMSNNGVMNFNISNNSTLTLNGNLSTTKGETTISFTGSSGAISGTFITGVGASTAFELGASDSQSVVATITGTFSNANGTGGTNSNYNGGENFFAINAKDTTLINGSNGLVFTSGSNTISFENTSGATLHWRGTSGDTEQNITTTGGNTEIKFSNSGTIAGGIDTSGGNTTLYLGGGEDGSKIEGMINGAITSSGSGANNVEFDNSNNTLTLKDNATFSQVSNLSDGNNNGISFYHTSRSSTDFKTLTIGSKDSTSGISGNGLNFLVYAISNTPNTSLETQPSARGVQNNTPKVYADKIVIHSSSNKEATTHTLGVVFENQDNINLDAISYIKGADNNILIASVSDSSKVSFNTQSTRILGFDVAQIDYVTEITDENGNISGSGYTSYFVGKAKATEVVVAEQEITATAFTLNYDLYMANLNSLNKRMGELRKNTHSQGVWARIFNGALSNEFGLGSKSNYTTIQAGYDYAFGFEGANNYLGVALSYALSTSTSQNAFDENGQRRGIDGIYSNAVEVALYNSYVSDNGWYNDSIAKFSYIMSKFDINNLNDNTSTSNDTSNFALTFSDEVGYVFKLGEAKEWSITPQIEATFGYFSQSDFKQTLANSNVYLDSMAENVLTLRTRVGSAFAYDFKNITQKDNFNASLYVGAFYEYDYVSGGEIKMSTQRETQTNKYSNLSSDGRMVMNVGTNMSIKDNTRLYFDFEKSFAGKITTDYQVNFGVRYSFGESNGYAPMIEKTESKAPLKVEEESKEEQGGNEIKEEKKEQKETENKEDSNPQDK